MSLLSSQLQAFLGVATQGTVHGAAKGLYLTQTAVTQRLRGLEQSLGATLFTRTRRGMKLTPEGEALLRYCHAAKDLEGEAMAQIKGGGKTTFAHVCLMGPTSMMHARVVPHCVEAAKRFPRLLLQFHISDTEDGIQALQTGVSQLSIVQQEQVTKEMASKSLQPEQYVLVCTAAWHSRSLKDIIKNERIIDFDPTDPVTFNYLKEYKLFESVNHERHFANRTDTLAMMLSKGYGYGLLTMEFCQPYVEQHQLIILNEGKIYENHMALVWYPRADPPDYFAALIDAIN